MDSMLNKKALWMGLAASLAITPFLVAQLTPPAIQQPSLPASPGAGDAANRSDGVGAGPLGAPRPAADQGPPGPIAMPAIPWQDAQILTRPAPPPEPTTSNPIGGLGYVEIAPPAAVALPPAAPMLPAPAPTFPALAPVLPAPVPVAGVPVAAQEKQPDQQKKEEPKKKEQPTTEAPAPVPSPTDLEGLRPTAPPPPTFGREAPATSTGQATIGPSAAAAPTNLSDVLSKSNAATGVEVQKRSPLVGDPRIDGLHFGEVVTYADGAYWFPARVDLDTVISKLNANIASVDIVKGPFSVRYGPGFSFLDVQSLPTPRSDGDYFDVHGSTSLRYQTNATAWQGEQTVSGGGKDWGFRLSYDIQSADDYASGNGTKMPSSYNNQFVNFAIGFDLSKDSSLELRYSHVQQSNVLIPGLVTDINELISDAFSARYTAVKGSWYDRLTIDAWVNYTSFNGDSSNPQTRQMVPGLDNFLQVPAGFSPVRLDITTNGAALSYGAREIVTWGDTKGFNISVGGDIRVFSSYYNEFDSFNFSTAGNGSGQAANLGIPNGRQIDPGLLADARIPVGENAIIKAGTRVDFVTTQFLGFGPNQNLVDPLNPPATDYVEHVGNPQGDKVFFLLAGYVTAENKLTNEVTVSAGYGYAERAPTLTELYAGGAFLGLLQNGLNSFYGNAGLRKEDIHQLDVGFNADYETFRTGGNAFYAFLPNYITYSRESNQFAVTLLNANGGAGPTFQTTVPNFGVFRFMNTNLATMYGFNGFAEYDATAWLTPFATLSYVEGWDQTHHEALPGIAPLDTRVGLRFHDRGKDPKWGVEYYARMVAVQDQYAASLGEQRTGGFVVHNVRAYWQARDNLLLLAGVENIGNLQYREALDLRTPPVGVFQPGINFYVGMKVSY
jgi:iron complex outermembrane recepter protein